MNRLGVILAFLVITGPLLPAAAAPRKSRFFFLGAKNPPEPGSKKWMKAMRKGFLKAVKEHIRPSGKKGFRLTDELLEVEWRLRPVKVIKKRFRHLGGEVFRGCVILKSLEKPRSWRLFRKDTLDVDFYAIKGPDGWTIDKVFIHKVNGKHRYHYDADEEMVPALETAR